MSKSTQKRSFEIGGEARSLPPCLKKKTSNPPRLKRHRRSKGKRGFRLLGLNLNADGAVKGFFGGNAYLAILALLFICVFLLKSGLGFVPGYRVELSEARQSGVELTNLVRYEVNGYQAMLARMNQAFIAEKRHRFGDEESAIYLYEEFEALVDDEFEDAVTDYLDLEEGAEKEAAAEKLKSDIARACEAAPEKDLLQAITRRLPDIDGISQEARSKAISMAQLYALNDFENTG